MGKDLNGNGLQIIEFQLKEISDMKNNKIESELAGLVFGLKEKQKKMKIRKWAWLRWVQNKKENKTKEKEEWAELIGIGMKIIILPINNNLK